MSVTITKVNYSFEPMTLPISCFNVSIHDRIKTTMELELYDFNVTPDADLKLKLLMMLLNDFDISDDLIKEKHPELFI